MSSNKDTIFIGHANPEDNEFSLWLALQLASHGYKVWCDLVKLLGGEDFWQTIEVVLRQAAIRHLYVLTRASNTKQGCLDELAVSRTVRTKEKIPGFIIPLHLDAIPHSEMNIELARLNAVDFSQSWATGLSQLLKRLEDDGIPHDTNSPAAACAFWRKSTDRADSLHKEPEPHLTNFFPINSLEQIYVHTLPKGLTPKKNLPFPFVPHGNLLVSFAPREDFPVEILHSTRCALEDFLLSRTGHREIHPAQAPRDVIDLLRRTWELHVGRKGLSTYQLANFSLAAYHIADRTGGKSLSYSDLDGKQTRRSVVGYKTMSRGNRRYWHVALSARPYLYPLGYRVLLHVLFGDNGKSLWTNTKAMQRARRSQCWDWWNDDWRDRLLASVQFLGDSIQTSSSSGINVATVPTILYSPVSFSDPAKNDPLTEADEAD